jgi:hypothetical protein
LEKGGRCRGLEKIKDTERWRKAEDTQRLGEGGKDTDRLVEGGRCIQLGGRWKIQRDWRMIQIG